MAVRSHSNPAAGALVAVLAAGCSGTERDPLPGQTELEAVLTVVDTVRLEEPPGDTIAELGHVHVLPEGGFLIADRILPRVRRYAADGGFVSAQGRWGDGPFEYRSVISVTADEQGRVYVGSDDRSRLTLLTPAQEPDTLLRLPDGRLPQLLSLRSGLLQLTFQVDEAAFPFDLSYRWAFLPRVEGEASWSVPAHPDRLVRVPYWSDVATTYGAVAGDSVLVANSFLYPLVLFGPEGRRLGEIGTPPPSWREAPELERGALAGVAGGRGLDVLEEWLASFTVVSGLFVVRDRWVVLSHGRARYDPLGGGPRFPYSFEQLDVYDLRSGEKVLEEVGLPQDARVLAGGPYLHVLIAHPPDPWTILRLDLSPLERAPE